MKKPRAKATPARRPAAVREEVRSEYDFSQARPSPYATRYAAGSNVVVLDPDVAAAFPSATEVNEVLRAVAGIIRQHRPKTRRSRTPRSA